MFLELRPPDLVELAAFLRQEAPAETRDLEPSDVLHQLARALQGLTLDEARYALAPRAGRQAASWGRSRCRPCSRKSACW